VRYEQTHRFGVNCRGPGSMRSGSRSAGLAGALAARFGCWRCCTALLYASGATFYGRHLSTQVVAGHATGVSQHLDSTCRCVPEYPNGELVGVDHSSSWDPSRGGSRNSWAPIKWET